MPDILGGLYKISDGNFLQLRTGKKFIVTEHIMDEYMNVECTTRTKKNCIECAKAERLFIKVAELNEEDMKKIEDEDIPYPNNEMKKEYNEILIRISVARMLHKHYYKNVKEIIHEDFSNLTVTF